MVIGPTNLTITVTLCFQIAIDLSLILSVWICVQEALNMVMPAMQLASKIPDVHVQLWASALLKGISPF
jgi:hypothetical protein